MPDCCAVVSSKQPINLFCENAALQASQPNVLKINFKIFTNTQPSQRDQNVIIILSSKHIIQPKRSSTYSKQSTSRYLTVLTSKRFTFIRRTSRYCPGTFGATNFSNPPPFFLLSLLGCLNKNDLVATDALVLIPEFLNGISKYLTSPTGCPVAGFDLDHGHKKNSFY